MGKLTQVINFYANLLAKNKKWFTFIALIFLGGVTSGLLIAFTNPKGTQDIIAGFAASIDTELRDGLGLSLYLFGRNAPIVLVASFLGAVLGLIPLLVTFINSSFLGVVIGFTLTSQTLNPVQLALLLLPHGVFEYAAGAIGLAFGLKLGVNWLNKRFQGTRKQRWFEDFRELVQVTPLVVFLLIVAALIEGNLTSRIACFVSGVCF